MQHMGFQNFSSPSPLPCLSPSSLLPSSPSPSSPSPSSLPPSFPPSPSAFTSARGSPTHCLPTSSEKVSAFLVPVLGTEFVLGLLGNSLALLIFCARLRPWTSNTVFLVSLVIADLLLVANLPLRVDYYLHHETWRFGEPACRANLFMLSTNRTASVVFLTAIAFNRYLKVVRPHHALSRASAWAAGRLAGLLWAGILLLNGHLLLTASPRRLCLSYRLGAAPSPWLRWHQALFVLEFFVPLAIILFAIVSIALTIRRRGLAERKGPRRAVRLLAAVVAVYTVCFLPSVLFGTASLLAFRLRACPALNACTQLFHGSIAFTYLNSVLDPALYCFSSPSFLRQGQALLGLRPGWQGSASSEGSCQPTARPRASRRAEATEKLQAEVSQEEGKALPRTGVCQEAQVHSLDC